MPQITHFYTQGPSSAVAISAMPTCWQRPAKMSKGGQLQLVSLMAVKSINCTASKDEELIENSPTLQNAMCFLLTVLFSFQTLTYVAALFWTPLAKDSIWPGSQTSVWTVMSSITFQAMGFYWVSAAGKYLSNM